MPSRITPWLVFAALLVPACREDEGDDGPDDGDDPPSSWLVGDDGEMLRLTATSDDSTEVSTYPLRHSDDLNAISCVGTATAWVAGDGGTVLVSRDAGQQWRTIDMGLGADLQAIAVAEGQPEGFETVWVAGFDGVVRRSTDGGRQWSSVDGPAIDWSGVATDPSGALAFVSGLDGSLWRSDDGGPLVRVNAGDGRALYDVGLDHHGDTVAAVGEGGLVLVGGTSTDVMTELASGTELDLHGLVVTSDATIVAVGEAGIVVHIDEQGARPHLAPTEDLALYDLHLRADGRGQAVGAGGTVLLTDDAGGTWRRVSTGRSADLRGVDDFHEAPHL